jgi:16S rRNA (adenine(1408)-N(1))-methyltransferase
METIRGRTSQELDFSCLAERLADYNHILLDLGTGDGRFVCCMAEQQQDRFFIGIDACRENLRVHSRSKLPNALFVIANAQALPQELNGLASHITINFPWGSLLESLLVGDPALMSGLSSISCLNAGVEIRLNGGALAEAGTTLEAGAEKIYHNMLQVGWQVETPVMMNASVLRSFPSTWAKRLAFGRDPRAIHLSVQKE